jgi:hypothetical protein
MKSLLRELRGLYVDDEALAVDLVAWCALAVLLLPAVLPRDSDIAAFFIGCLVVFLGNVTVAAVRAHRGPGVDHFRVDRADADHADASAEFSFRGGEKSLP